MEFVAYIFVNGTRVTKEQVATAIELGLERIFKYDAGDVQTSVDVHVSQSWQPGHMNSLTATRQRGIDGD